MRPAATAALGALALLGCSGADPPTPTSGPLESIVHIGPTAVQLYAYRHPLDLAALPIDPPFGLPLAGPIELDANVSIPLTSFQPDVRRIFGRGAVRCVGHCRLGDDRTPVRDAAGGFSGDLAFSHLDLDGLEAQVEIKRGVARLTRWRWPSTELETEVGLEVRLASTPTASALDGCVRFRPTAALATRDRHLHDLATLTGAAQADGWFHLQIAGTVGSPRLIAARCEPSPGG